MNTRCDKDELVYQLLQKFYELAKEPEKWKKGNWYMEHLVNGIFRVEPVEHRAEFTCHHTGYYCCETTYRYALHANDNVIAKTTYKTVEVEPARVETVTRTVNWRPWWNWFRKTYKTQVSVPSVTKQIPDDFHQTCASLFAAWEDWQECVKLTEALQSLSGKQSPKTKEVKAVPAKAPRKAPVSPPAPKQQPKKPSSVKPSRKPKGS